MKERPIVKERADWWQAVFGLIMFGAGIHIVSHDLIIGVALIAGGALLAVHSKKQVPVAS